MDRWGLYKVMPDFGVAFWKLCFLRGRLTELPRTMLPWYTRERINDCSVVRAVFHSAQ